MAACATERPAAREGPGRALAAPGTVRDVALLALLALWVGGAGPARAGTALEWRGEASAMGIFGDREQVTPGVRLRYVPEALVTWKARPGLSFDADAAGELQAETRWPRDAPVETDTDASFYRLWASVAGSATEVRAGLQQVDFGSATLLRPLMWFDTLDPRDPLKATAGVWGVRWRQSLPYGAGLWAWGLLGNDERRGWDLLPSSGDEPEAGARLQVPVPRGEVAGAYHHRTAEFALPGTPGAPPMSQEIAEDRFGFDARWDVGIGAWLEGSWTDLRDTPLSGGWQSALCAGGDYTFGVLDGLTVALEHMRLDASDDPLARGTGRDLTAFSVFLRLGVLDTVRGFGFKDWETGADSQVIEVRRTWDHWSVHLLGFRGGDALGAFGPDGAFPAGNGGQLMLVYQHGTE